MKTSAKILGSVWLLSNLFTAYADPPPMNLSEVKSELKTYHDAGVYLQDIASVTNAAKAYIDQRLQTATPEEVKKFAIVYDVDETALSNYEAMSKNDYGAPLQYVFACMQQGKDSAIQPTLDLYNYAAAKGIAQFFITGRPEKFRAVTESNLKKAGYQGWVALYMEPDNVRYPDVEDYKAPLRQKIEAEGYDILFSIGDQCSDLEAAVGKPLPPKFIVLPKVCPNQKGDFEDAVFKLPNPYYSLK